MQKTLNSLKVEFNSFSYFYRIILSVLISVSLMICIWDACFYKIIGTSLDANHSFFKKLSLSISLPLDSEPIETENSVIDEDLPKDEFDNDIPDEIETHDYIVSSGDTLSNILNQYGIEIADIRQLVKADPHLYNVKIGQKFSWTLNNSSQLKSVTWERSRRESRRYDRVQDRFKLSVLLKTGKWQRDILTVIVNGSFIKSAKLAGLSNSEIAEVIKSLQWQIDFRKLRDGDDFRVLTMREILDGQRQQSELIGVRLSSSGKNYYAIRASDGKFYDRSGSGLTSGFMRFPTVRRYRISSHFDPRRANPVTGRIAPHKGVDFAVPIGTPILSIGDGEVMVSKCSSTAGNYVAIRHGRQYMTRYMHLKTLLVKPGDRVKRGQCIAFSGNTGRSTGPHVHFEIWINNHAVNPLTARLPCMRGITGEARRNYLDRVNKTIMQFNKR
ncbi:murein DD-endopeptidase MepM [Candidatus Erwinia haradaeae]|uniref:Murein DD-endopeptidase MepM n=1 Tax=Candidatus Erwinia haradaeae TaxID=1922217 RepID=A0A451D880_9GAMM|nr:murein DD-endopeptidase MepM [Candidatus Erwinia haradaeae]VFP82032.1 Murein DD-endopeptidase MepM [Candidatus Erwinia haradaeae]